MKGSGNVHVVDRHEFCDQFGQNDKRYIDLANPPMLKLTKLGGSRSDYVFDQVWDCNQHVLHVVFPDGEQGDAHCDDENDNARRQRKRCGRLCKGTCHRFQKYVDKMKLETENDPFGFHVENIELPVSTVVKDKFCGARIQILRSYEHEVLEGLADPSKHLRITLGMD